jgi:cell division protein FtsW (lipid II flippase)
VLALAGFLADRARRIREPQVVLQASGSRSCRSCSSSSSRISAPRSSTRPRRRLPVRGRHPLEPPRRARVVGALVIASVVWFLPGAGVEVLEPYQTARLTGFTNPDSDPSGATYNVTQSITAVGSGGLNGRGVEGATQTRLDYLPEHHTDFVFAALAEQRGFFGAAILLGLYLLVVWRGLRVIAVARDAFSAIVAGGIVIAFLFRCSSTWG